MLCSSLVESCCLDGAHSDRNEPAPHTDWFDVANREKATHAVVFCVFPRGGTERSHWCEASLLNAMIAAGACPNPRAARVSPRAPELMRKIVSDASVQEEQAIVPAQV